ncbi:30S ribosomal protein S18 [Candidatus Roizmanbacteria bacterium RIFCSPLOWO2_02_FULL_37_19]|uniref:Small ribosomal subunit protein bS18 n=1 Tax=Candidatus Roizmanbacteria bacterium RIFCSPHIGHO2_02_FULL_37_24 TaxID=1802037 RepID=A0A1F7GY98_9BACT|nr:MAG: 30S ribosomal protein S18 [Candidatus Roizmanbacteria bacterium RIFCSPHIGHO2_02_FULL_37_24]OGK33700.1 MAG: 30S ribosomal protein S18 [Candidatus Roizmanbacteria bacterium RIFCSPHIGHO2_12_FULL_37_23]OGK55156.1 MAG: 30S ribosomal protein S18 [Candidatus Roizmanbacteria bacterium RIFCSPLOWO2_02_FULL_37_19]OGK58874.1 MAG: 30S ribosomal protein S18 [Candidatus Roizmanbacteria bacterium RIFCSPLOWO2_12_FULL_37_7b]
MTNKNKDYFDTYKTKPSFKDSETLKRFLTPRGKILSTEKSGLSAKNQRKLSKQIKYARYLGLLPYTSYQSEKLQQNLKK